MKGLTKRQGEIVTYVKDYIAQKEFSPSYREIRDRFGFSSLGTVYRHVQTLKKKGALQGLANSSRSLIASSEPQSKISAHEIPLIGELSEHRWIETFHQIKMMELPPYLLDKDGDSHYLLRVKGDFLREELICEGDLLVVKTKKETIPGEVLVARIDGCITVVKRHYPEGHFIRLEGLHQPMMIKAASLEIQGVLVGLIRLAHPLVPAHSPQAS